MKGILLFLLSCFSLTVAAQDTTLSVPGRYLLLSIEGGISVNPIGSITHVRPDITTSIPGHASISPSFSIKAIHVFRSRWGFGIRTEIASWLNKDGMIYTNDKGEPLSTGKVYYAKPAISVAPHVSKIVLEGRSELSVGLYAGIVFSTQKAQGVIGSLGNAIAPVTPVDAYQSPATGLQFGAELQYRYWVKPRIGISATASLQRNAMVYNNYNDFGFGLNTSPVTIGAFFRL